MESDFIYLYGFSPMDARPPADVRGIAGRPVLLVDYGGVKAVVSKVPADVYDPGQIDDRLQDLRWVAEQGVSHETVVAWFVDHSEILPVSLFTLYSNESALREAVEERAELLDRELRRLRDKREWDMKVSFNERDVEAHASEISPRIAELEEEARRATPGKRYLIEKQRNDLLKSETRKAARALASQVIDAVRPFTDDVRTLPIPSAADELPVILHAALLVDRARSEHFVDAMKTQAARLRDLGMTLNFSGPWAPYRFTGDDERSIRGQ